MNIEYKFNVGEKIKILELGLYGRVKSLWTGNRGNEIQVRFFCNGKSEEMYFYEDELESV